jgi:hypothetical protein
MNDTGSANGSLLILGNSVVWKFPIRTGRPHRTPLRSSTQRTWLGQRSLSGIPKAAEDVAAMQKVGLVGGKHFEGDRAVVV